MLGRDLPRRPPTHTLRVTPAVERCKFLLAGRVGPTDMCDPGEDSEFGDHLSRSVNANNAPRRTKRPSLVSVRQEWDCAAESNEEYATK
jgi:hypothetical protein